MKLEESNYIMDLPPTQECHVTRDAPRVGFNLVSWDAARQTDTSTWGRAIQEMYDAGVRDFTIVTYRFVDKTTGQISPGSGFHLASPPENKEIIFSIKKGTRLGMRASLNPFIEIDNPKGIGHEWRGTLNFSGSNLERFFRHYSHYLSEMATLAREIGACRLYIGSELKALTVNPSARKHWTALIQSVRRILGKGGTTLTYAANHDDYTKVPFWDELDEIGIDAYFLLVPQTLAVGRGKPSIETVQTGWEKILEPIKRFSEERHKSVIFSEWGTVPFDLTTSQPWNWKPSEIADPEEQLHAYQGTLAALLSQGNWLEGVVFWHWGMPGNEGSPYRITSNSQVGRFIRSFLGSEMPRFY
jgi:hypothetical protein